MSTLSSLGSEPLRFVRRRLEQLEHEVRRLSGCGRYGEAATKQREVCRLLRRFRGDDVEELCGCLGRLGELLDQAGRPVRARSFYRVARDRLETHLRGRHPELFSVPEDSGRLRHLRLEYDLAVGQALNRLAHLYHLTGRGEEARPLVETALAIARPHLGVAHPDFAVLLANLANLEHAAGHFEEAEPLYRQALKMLRTALGETHPACQAHEEAFEDVYDGTRPGGALTHFLLEALDDFPARERPCRELYQRLKARLHTASSGQTPQLEGAGDRVLLGSDEAVSRSAFTVLEIDDAGRLLLDAGAAHGLVEGARVVLHPPGTQDLEESTASAELVEIVDGASSWAELAAGEAEAVEQGARAVVLGWGGRRAGHTVRLPASPPAPAADVARLRGYLAREEALEVLPASAPDAAADFAINAEAGRYVLWERGGEALSPLLDPRPFEDPRASLIMARRLVHLARFRDVLELTPDRAGSSLGGALRLESDRTRLRAGEPVGLTVHNVSGQVLNVTVLELDFTTFGIRQIYPPARGGASRSFEPEQRESFEWTGPRGDNTSAGKVVFKAFGTLDPTSFRWLEMPPVGESFRESGEGHLNAWGWTVAQCRLQGVR